MTTGGLTNFVMEGLENCLDTQACLQTTLRLRTAYHTSHNIILDKIIHCGFNVKLLSSYLAYRTQFVNNYDNCSSATDVIKFSVTQLGGHVSD